MDKDQERSFLETLARSLVSLPFDLKVLLEAVSDPDLEHEVREIAAAAVVYIISPREGNIEPYLRYGEDAAMLRLAARHILVEGGESATQFRQRFAVFEFRQRRRNHHRQVSLAGAFLPQNGEHGRRRLLCLQL